MSDTPIQTPADIAPRFNHVAMSLPAEALDEDGRRDIVAFYREVFGWQTRTESDSDEFRYSTAVFTSDPRVAALLPAGGEELLGVMDGAGMLPEGATSKWVTFFGADEVDKTLAVITDHGGSVVRGAEDTPYGRLAAAADPTGALFNLFSLPAA